MHIKNPSVRTLDSQAKVASFLMLPAVVVCYEWSASKLSRGQHQSADPEFQIKSRTSASLMSKLRNGERMKENWPRFARAWK